MTDLCPSTISLHVNKDKSTKHLCVLKLYCNPNCNISHINFLEKAIWKVGPKKGFMVCTAHNTVSPLVRRRKMTFIKDEI